jgi:hypothetical protein
MISMQSSRQKEMLTYVIHTVSRQEKMTSEEVTRARRQK